MLRIIIDPTRPKKNLQIAQQVTKDEQHQNHPGKGNDHFLAYGRAIKAGEVGHEDNTVVYFNLAFNQDRAEAADNMSARRTGRQPVFLEARPGTQTFQSVRPAEFYSAAAANPVNIVPLSAQADNLCSIACVAARVIIRKS